MTGSTENQGERHALYALLVPLISAVVGGLLGAGATLIATGSANDSAARLQQEKFRYEQAEARRAKQEHAYNKYLDAAYELALATDRYLFACPEAAVHPVGAVFYGPRECASYNGKTFAPATDRYRKAEREASMHWSVQAKRAAEAVGREVPVSGTFPDGKLRFIEWKRYTQAEKQFRTAMCLDTRLVPDHAC